MRKPIARFRFSLPILLAAASVFAGGDENPRVRYQNQLLASGLSGADKKLCDERVGERSDENAAAYDQCKVTRLFVADLVAKKDVPGAPPMLKGSFLNKAEIAMVADAIKPK